MRENQFEKDVIFCNDYSVILQISIGTQTYLLQIHKSSIKQQIP